MSKHSEYINAFGPEVGEAVFRAIREELTAVEERDYPGSLLDSVNVREHAVDAALNAANEILGGHGIGAIESAPGERVSSYYLNIVLLYVNLGDTYDTTVLYDTREDQFLVGNWGNWLEEMEEDEEDEEDGEDEEDDIIFKEHFEGDE